MLSVPQRVVTRTADSSSGASISFLLPFRGWYHRPTRQVGLCCVVGFGLCGCVFSSCVRSTDEVAMDGP